MVEESHVHAHTITPGSRKRVVWLYEEDHLIHPFIRLASDSLQEHGYSVTVIDGSPQPGVTAYRHRPMTLPPPVYLGPLHLRGVAAVGALFRVIREVASQRPAAIIATLPAGGLVGWIASRLLGCRLIYYPFELYDEQIWPSSRFWTRIETLLLRIGVDALITQNEERARVYVDERGARVEPVIIRNYKRWYPVRRSGILRQQLGLSCEDRIVLYEGGLNPGRWLDRLVSSAAYLPEGTRLIFMGNPSHWWRRAIEPLIASAPLAGRVLVVPWVPHSELLQYVADADVGVIIYDDAVRNNYFCAPGKLSDYVLAGVPIVAPTFPTIAPLITQHSLGVTFDNSAPSSIADAIAKVLAIPPSTWGQRLSKAAPHLEWETQVPNLLQAVSGRPAAALPLG